MGREKEMWKALRPVMLAWELDPWRIETPSKDGVPDVNYTHGWIELKCIEGWPKKKDSPVRIDHFTVEQRVWGLKRWLAGGVTWLLLHVKSEGLWLLYDGQTAYEVVGKLNKDAHLIRAFDIVRSPAHLIALKEYKR